MTTGSRPAGIDPEALLAALEHLDRWAALHWAPGSRAIDGAAAAAGGAPAASASAAAAAAGEILNATGALGAYLDAAVAPLPAFATGAGTLVVRPPDQRSPGVLAIDLPAGAPAAGSLGTLFLDRPAAGSRAVARFLAGAFAAARARAELAQSTDRLDALDEAIRAMAAVLSADRVLQVIVDRVRDLVGATYAALGIVDPEGTIEQFITSGMSRADRTRIGAPPHGHGLLGLIIRENQSYRIDDITRDPRRYGFPAHHPAMHSFLGVPISVHGRTIGNLYLTEKAGGFAEADQRIVETFAAHAAIAIENARLHDQVQRLAIVEERERIGRDLHDGVIQSIYAVGLSLEDVPEMMDDEPDDARRRVERAIESLDQTIRDIRNFIFGLRPQLLDGVGFLEGAAALADEFRVNTMVDVELQSVPGLALTLEESSTLELLSITREALSNIARHAKATRAVISVGPSDKPRDILISIGDNGIGFDPAAPRGLSHQGLRNMSARAAGIGAVLAIESQPDAGTRIIVRVPRDGAPVTAGDTAAASQREEPQTP